MLPSEKLLKRDFVYKLDVHGKAQASPVRAANYLRASPPPHQQRQNNSTPRSILPTKALKDIVLRFIIEYK
jgi:hypothetical protein